jgi:hypothetical protein
MTESYNGHSKLKYLEILIDPFCDPEDERFKVFHCATSSIRTQAHLPGCFFGFDFFFAARLFGIAVIGL